MMNLILDTDSYKYSHYLQYPSGTSRVYSYIESRGGQHAETLFFGLNYYLRKYLSKRFTKGDIDEAEVLVKAHGEPFNREGFEYILKHWNGYFPVTIRAVPEGTVVPTKNVLVDIVNNDEKVPWVTSFLETALLRSVWYPTTVATREFEIRKTIQKYLKETADASSLDWIGVKHNDFGARGVSSHESSGIGGLAHLACFTGTDNIPALEAARQYYDEPLAGYSIPAAEHSTMTSWGGKDGEPEAMKNMLQKFARKGSLVAVVSDSYDIMNAVRKYWCGSLLKAVQDSGATVVIRPDSGDPIETPVAVIQELMKLLGYTVNSKGYRMLPPYYKVIQGDGINEKTIVDICYRLKDLKISTDNIAFGMGGAMLQQMDRDTQKFAMKCSAIEVNSEWKDVYKSPVGDITKTSKKGQLELYRNGLEFRTVRRDIPQPWGDKSLPLLQTVFENGEHVIPETLKEVRSRVEYELTVRGY